MSDDLCAVTLLQHCGIAGMIVVEMRDQDVFEVVLFPIEQLNQEVAHAVGVFRQRPVAGVDEHVLALTADQVDATLDVAVELVLGERAMQAGNAPAVRRFGEEEDHPVRSSALRSLGAFAGA
jgi:hypothetical protein